MYWNGQPSVTYKLHWLDWPSVPIRKVTIFEIPRRQTSRDLCFKNFDLILGNTIKGLSPVA